MSGISPVGHQNSGLRFEDEIEVLEYEGKSRKLSLAHPETQDFLSQLRIQTVFSRILPRRDLDRLNELLEYEELELITPDESSEVEELQEQHKRALLSQIEEKRQVELDKLEKEEDQRWLESLHREEERSEFLLQDDLFPLDNLINDLNLIDSLKKIYCNDTTFLVNYIQEILSYYQGVFDKLRMKHLSNSPIKNVEQLQRDLFTKPSRKIGFPHETEILQKLNDLRNLVNSLSASSFELTLPPITPSEFSFNVDSQNSVMQLLESSETTDTSKPPASRPNQMKSITSHEIESSDETQDSNSEEPDYARDVIEIKGQYRNIYSLALYVISHGLHDPNTTRPFNGNEIESIATHFGLTNRQLVDIFISAKARDRKDARAGLPVFQNKDPIATLARKLFEQAISDNNGVDRANYLMGGLAWISPI